MSSRIRFRHRARRLRGVQGLASDRACAGRRLRAARLCARVARLVGARSTRSCFWPACCRAAKRSGGRVSASARFWDRAPRMTPSRSRRMGSRARGGAPPRRARNRDGGRPGACDDLARPRGWPLRRQRECARSEADRSGPGGLCAGGERCDRAGDNRRRPAGHRRLDRRLRRGGDSFRRRGRGARDRAQIPRRQSPAGRRRGAGAKARMMIVSLLSDESGGTRCRTTRL